MDFCATPPGSRPIRQRRTSSFECSARPVPPTSAPATVMRRRQLTRQVCALGAALIAAAQLPCHAASAVHDTVVRRGWIYDGSGAAPYVGDLVIDGDRVTYVG